MVKFKRCSVKLSSLGEKAICKGDLAVGEITINLKKLSFILYLCHNDYPSNRDNLANIYILSEDKDEIINTGDWYYDTEDNRVDQLREDELCMSYDKKIIATNNLAMDLPRLPKGFIEKYIKTFNEDKPIEEAMVEYEENYGIGVGFPEDDSYLKIDKSNRITIKRIKDNYTREEHIKDIKTAVQDAISYPEKFVTGICFDNSLFDEWLEENL